MNQGAIILKTRAKEFLEAPVLQTARHWGGPGWDAHALPRNAGAILAIYQMREPQHIHEGVRQVFAKYIPRESLRLA